MKIWFILVGLFPILGFAYVAWHTWQILPFPIWVKITVIALLAFCLCCTHLNFDGGLEQLPLSLAALLYKCSTACIFILLYSCMVYGILDIGKWTGVIPQELLKNSVAGTAIVSGILICLFTYGNIHYYHKKRIKIDITTEKPLSKDYKIIMASDLHLGYNIGKKELAGWIDKFNAEKPNLILIGGDIIDRSTRPLKEEGMAEEFKRLQAPVYACEGNHDYYTGIRDAMDFYTAAGINLLRDSTAVIDSSLCIIGRKDRGRNGENPRLTLEELNSKCDSGLFSILLEHQPFNLEDAQAEGIDFEFCGHTHHGQVWPANWCTNLLYEDAYGPLQKGNTRYYVSSGLGIWGVKYRIGTCSEYVVLTVSRKH